MSKEKLIKTAHIWAVAVVLFAVIAFATKAGSNPAHSAQENQNQNQNSNQNQNRNSNTNQNANLVTNRNNNANNANATAAEAAGTGALSSRDQKFLMDTAMAGLKEVELGRWGAQKGTSPEVKQFGQQMVDHHSKANTELAQLASSKGVTLPTQLDEKQQRDLVKITRLSGAEFERAFSKEMLKDHENAVKEFEKQSTNATDADLKAFAAKALPTLQQHLEMARALPGNAGRGNSNVNVNSNGNVNSNSNRNSNSNNSNNSNNP